VHEPAAALDDMDISDLVKEFQATLQSVGAKTLQPMCGGIVLMRSTDP
jgi:hypothetical protein